LWTRLCFNRPHPSPEVVQHPQAVGAANTDGLFCCCPFPPVALARAAAAADRPWNGLGSLPHCSCSPPYSFVTSRLLFAPDTFCLRESFSSITLTVVSIITEVNIVPCPHAALLAAANPALADGKGGKGYTTTVDTQPGVYRPPWPVAAVERTGQKQNLC